MPSAAEKAKAKYEAVLEDAKGNMHAMHRPNRVMSTKYPSTGVCEFTNVVPRRTSTSSSTGSERGRFRTMIKNMLSPPAF
ncbi:hypothetical protein PT974_09591 [Cladobotryum mycophilum]|uniref:Uncharacterized protein n=1 Tax=Cladobotryum mycophilum TaxID=491253 RepID=A0ABR0SHT4_9HYPO